MHATKAYGEQLHLFLTSALGGVVWSASRPVNWHPVPIKQEEKWVEG
jgi:hypothetical protein